MQVSDAYAALAKELEAVRQLPLVDLLALVDARPLVHELDIAGERVELEVLVSWRDDTHESVRITGHARGPSTWHTEHLRESVTVQVQPSTGNGA